MIIYSNGYKITIAQLARSTAWFIATVERLGDSKSTTYIQSHTNDYIGYNYFNEARPYPKHIVPTRQAAITLAHTLAAKDFKRDSITVTDECPF